MASKKKITKKSSAKKPVAKKSKKTTKAAPAPKKSGAKKSVSTRKAGLKPKRVVRKTKRPAPKRKPASRSKLTKPVKRDSSAPAPEALALAKSIATVAHDKKAESVLIIDTRARASSVGYDYVVLASGETDRQLSAIYEGVEALLKPQGKRASSVEASPDWVCVSYDAGVVAHFFTPDKREQVDFEGLWKDAPRVS